jgi:hypothetical protein
LQINCLSDWEKPTIKITKAHQIKSIIQRNNTAHDLTIIKLRANGNIIDNIVIAIEGYITSFE